MPVSSIQHAFGILKGGRSGDVEEASNFLGSMSPNTLRARAISESKTNSRPKSYAKKYRMGMKVY